MIWTLGVSNFLEEISSLPILFFPLFICNVHLRRPSYLSLFFSRTLYSVGYIFPFIPWLSLLYFLQLSVSPPQTTTLPSCISFSLEWFWSLLPVQCYEPLSIVLQAIGLPYLIPWIYSSLPLHNHKGFDLGHTWVAGWFFPEIFLSFAIRSVWSEPQSAPVFLCWLCRVSLSRLQATQ